MNDQPPSSKALRRKLSQQEIALWTQIARTVVPRPGSKLPETDTPADRQKPEPIKEKPAIPHPENVPEKKRSPRSRHPPLAPLEHRLRQRLSRGQISIEMKIDLHGMRQDEALMALRHFLMRARHQQARIVLVVTGKGKSTSADGASRWAEPGILRRAVPHWLSAPELRSIVLGFEEASASHGGAGALYVRLRSGRRSESHHP